MAVEDPRRWQDYEPDEGDWYPPEAVEKMVDESLALTSHVLYRRGMKEAAEAMLQIVRHEMSEAYDFGQWNGTLWLEYEPESADLFHDRHDDAIAEVWHEMRDRQGYPSQLNTITSVKFFLWSIRAGENNSRNFCTASVDRTTREGLAKRIHVGRKISSFSPTPKS